MLLRSRKFGWLNGFSRAIDSSKLRIRCRCIEAGLRQCDPLRESWDDRGLDVHAPDGLVYVTMLDPGLQNLAVGRAMFGIEGNVAWCDFLVVDSPYRGLGIGEKMIRYVNQLGLIVLGRSNHEEVPEVFWSSLIGS